MLNRLSFMMVIAMILIYSAVSANPTPHHSYVMSEKTTTVHYHVNSSGMYVLWFDQLIDQTADIDVALSVCEAMDGLYDYELDECTVDALPIYVDTVGANLDYYVHVL